MKIRQSDSGASRVFTWLALRPASPAPCIHASRYQQDLQNPRTLHSQDLKTRVMYAILLKNDALDPVTLSRTGEMSVRRCTADPFRSSQRNEFASASLPRAKRLYSPFAGYSLCIQIPIVTHCALNVMRGTSTPRLTVRGGDGFKIDRVLRLIE